MEQNLFFFLKNKKHARYLYDNLPVSQGMRLMRDQGYSAVPVISKEGEYMGSLSEGDFLYFLLDHPDADLDAVLVRELIRPDYIPAVSFDVEMQELLARSLKQNYVPVVDDRNVFIGLVTRQSILTWLIHNKSRP